jgi:serine/threonine-protein kinase
MSDLRKLDRYEVSTYVFSDEFADTYIAYDILLDRKVILKVFTSGITSDTAYFEKFLRGVRIAADLVHTNIIWVWDIGTEKQHYYLAMRYFEGKAVSKVMDNQGPIPWGDALLITEQIANALQFAHEQGFVHGNVNTRNILISATKEAVLTDFGFSNVALEEIGESKADRVNGLPNFVPPEAWEANQVSPAGDQYALAWTLVEMLTGRRLFEGATLQDLREVPEEPLQLWETWPVGVPSHIVEILQKALDSDPTNRYPDVESYAVE